MDIIRGRKDYNGNGIMAIIRPYSPEHLHSVHFRHIEVKKDELRAADFGALGLCVTAVKVLQKLSTIIVKATINVWQRFLDRLFYKQAIVFVVICYKNVEVMFGLFSHGDSSFEAPNLLINMNTFSTRLPTIPEIHFGVGFLPKKLLEPPKSPCNYSIAQSDTQTIS